MRLICPNCGAQYEVAEDAVPDIGRDVQCSNCGHTWFENPGASVAAEEELVSVKDIDEQVLDSEAETASDNDEPDFYEDEATEEQESASMAEDEAGFEEDIASDDASAVEENVGSAEDITSELAADVEEEVGDVASKLEEAGASPTAPAARHGLEDSVADILREEAEREQSARLEEGSLETQTDMPMDPPADAAETETRSRIARLKGEETAAVAALAAKEASRKEALPDIDEISSTLRTNAERGESVPPPPEEVEETKRKGFRWGFWGVILLILIAVLVYLFSDMIIAAVPAIEGPVTSYVAMIDGLRSSITGLVEGAASSLEGDTEVASE